MLSWSNVRFEASQLKRKAERAFYRLRTPIRRDEMRSAIARLTGGGREILFVHASLSSCGRFTPGPEDVLSGLRQFCETLAFPIHPYCYPSSPEEPGPLFDPAMTPSKNGLLTEMFRKDAKSVRSIHATHSLAASGV